MWIANFRCSPCDVMPSFDNFSAHEPSRPASPPMPSRKEPRNLREASKRIAMQAAIMIMALECRMGFLSAARPCLPLSRSPCGEVLLHGTMWCNWCITLMIQEIGLTCPQVFPMIDHRLKDNIIMIIRNGDDLQSSNQSDTLSIFPGIPGPGYSSPVVHVQLPQLFKNAVTSHHASACAIAYFELNFAALLLNPPVWELFSDPGRNKLNFRERILHNR